MGLPKGYIARAATLADVPAVTSCVRAAYEHYVARNGRVPGPMRDDYAELVSRHDVTVVEHAGAVVAVLVLKETSEGFLLDNVAVSPDCQGLGLGRYLLGLAEEKALAGGYDALYLYTQEIMTENRALYERAGYLEYARRHELGLDRVYMRKRLRPEA